MKYIVKNFRVFDQSGTTFEMAPITMLTGCNSSGKSSLVKSMLLLSNYYQSLKSELSVTGKCFLETHPIGITQSQLQLGRIDNVIHHDSNDKTIHIAYQIQPDMAADTFEVEYIFGAKDNDQLNEGYLQELNIYILNKELVLKLSSNGHCLVRRFANLSYLIKSFYSAIRYLSKELLVNANLCYEFMGEESGYTKDEIGKLKEELQLMSPIKISTETLDKMRMCYANATISDKICSSKLFPQYSTLLKHKVLNYMPIFDKLDGVKKDDVRNILLSIVDDDDTRALLNDFEQSHFETLLEYFRYQESTKGLCFKMDDLEEGGLVPMSLQQHLHFCCLISTPHWDMDGITIGTFDFDNNRFIERKPNADEIEKYRLAQQQRREKLDFNFIADTLRIISCKIDSNFAKTYADSADTYSLGLTMPSFTVFSEYVQWVLSEMILPSRFLNHMNYISSSSVQIQRLYAMQAQNSEFEKLLHQYFVAKANYRGDYIPDSFMNTWVEKFGIGKRICAKNTAEGLGITISIHDSEKDKEGHLLADEGYGITQLLSILLTIETIAMSRKTHKEIESGRKIVRSSKTIERHNVSVIAIEEPENHLHPQYQSLLMDMFDDAYKKFNIHFIIETHSEYLIRRSQVLVAQNKYKDETELVQRCPYKVYYIPRPQDGKPYDLEYKINGKFKNKFGKGFFDVADSLMLDLL